MKARENHPYKFKKIIRIAAGVCSLLHDTEKVEEKRVTFASSFNAQEGNGVRSLTVSIVKS